MNKTGPGCKYFYTVMDCGLILGKAGVSLAKTMGADRYAGGSNISGLSDYDRAGRTIGRVDGGGVVAGDSVRGGAASGSPEYAVSGPPGVISTRAWVGRGQRGMRNPLGATTGVAEAQCGAGMGGN